MINFNDYVDKFRVMVRPEDGPTFHFISLGWHYHANDDEQCSFRWGFNIALFGILFSFGKFRAYLEE